MNEEHKDKFYRVGYSKKKYGSKEEALEKERAYREKTGIFQNVSEHKSRAKTNALKKKAAKKANLELAKRSTEHEKAKPADSFHQAMRSLTGYKD